MKNKLIWGMVIVLFAGFVSSCPEGQICPDEQPAYNYDQFQSDFSSDPLSAAQNHPAEYMKYIQENPQAVAEHPQAYEAAIQQDVAYINQNKDAFLSYAQTKGVIFSSIDGEFKSFDTGTRKIETKGPKGETITSFSFDEIKILGFEGGSNFRISKEGELTYESEKKETIRLRGNLKLATEGSLFEIDVIVTEGKITLSNPSLHTDYEIELTGGNSARLLPSCHSYTDRNCGFAEVTVVNNVPLAIGKSILLKGKVTIRDPLGGFLEVDLHEGSKYQTSLGTTIEVTKLTRVTPIDGNCVKEYSCIQEVERPMKPTLTVRAVGDNKIQISAKDELYKSVIVRQIGEHSSHVLVGEIDGRKIYITKLGTYEYELGDGVLDFETAGKVREHPNFAVAKQEASELPLDTATVDLALTKQDGSISRMAFSRDMPISQGNIAGLQTNIGHVFAIDGYRFPWLLYQGELTTTANGKWYDGLDFTLSLLMTPGTREAFSLLWDSVDTLQRNELISLMRSVHGNKESLRKILDKYRVSGSYSDSLIFQIDALQKFNVDTPAAEELQGELLDKLDEISSEDVTPLLLATKGRYELQYKVISKSKEINDPASALSQVRDPSLQKRIIKKSAIIYPSYERSIHGDITKFENYLHVLETKTSPKIQDFAIETINFEEGVFKSENHKGEALRRLLEFYDDPGRMKRILERFPQRPDMAFNPDVFSLVYFNNHFKEKTENLDFANRFSVAHTAQRYLERPGGRFDEQNVARVVDLIVAQRDRFSAQVILDEDTYYIPVTHEEDWFQNSEMVQLARDSGVKQMAEQDMKGAGAKGRFLDSVTGSNDKGKTTIHFNNHGGPNHQWLSKGQAGVETSDEMRRPEAISYVEFGDALAERGNVGDVTVVIDSCYSKDFTDNLYHYMSAVKGMKDMPTVITATNRGQVGWANTFGSALRTVHTQGKPLIGADILKAESVIFTKQDLTVTMPIVRGEEARFGNPLTPGVIDIGSPVDDGAAEPPQKPQGEPSENEPAELPPIVIEIAQNEQEMEEILAQG